MVLSGYDREDIDEGGGEVLRRALGGGWFGEERRDWVLVFDVGGLGR